MAIEDAVKTEEELVSEMETEAEEGTTALEAVQTGINELTELVKSNTGAKDKPEEDDPKPVIDFENTSVEELAKSIRESALDPKELIGELCGYLDIDVMNILSPDGEPYINDEMQKSLEHYSAEGDQGAAAILGINELVRENAERNGKILGACLHGIGFLAKSLEVMTNEMTEMKKSFSEGATVIPPEGEVDTNIEDQADMSFPETGDDVSADPLSKSHHEEEGGELFTRDKEAEKEILKKAFSGQYGNNESIGEFYYFADMLGEMSLQDIFMKKMNNEQQAKMSPYLPSGLLS